MRKLSVEEVKRKISEKGLEFFDEKYINSKLKFKIKCFCGKFFYGKYQDIIYGHTTSCGCKKGCSEKDIKSRLKQKKLTLMSAFTKVYEKHKIKCFCGKIFSSVLNSIFYGNKISCGCLNKNIKGKLNCMYNGYEDLSGQYFSRLKIGAKRCGRDMPFLITKKYIWELFLRQNKKCSLSGIDLFLDPSNSSKQTASLDRIDSNKGYIEGNVQWVHKRINIMKLDDSDKDFIKWCEMIVKHRGRN